MINSTQRTRNSSAIICGDWYKSQGDCCAVVMDNCLYDSPDPLRTARNTNLPIHVGSGWGAGKEYSYIGTNADTTIPDPIISGYYTPDTFWPASYWPNYGSSYDSERDVMWVSVKPAGLPLWGRDPLATVYHLLPPVSTFADSQLQFQYRVSLDTVTEDHLDLMSKRVILNNPAILLGYQDSLARSWFFKACKWSWIAPGTPQLVDTKYLRVDVYGMLPSLIKLAASSSNNLLTEDPDTTVYNASSTVFAGCQYELNSYHTKAAAKANRGSMDLAITLVEAHKTKELVLSLKPRLEAYARQIRYHRLKGKTYKQAKKAASLWLEARYGWRQIYFDVRDLMEVYARMFKRMRHSYTSGTGKVPAEVTSEFTAWNYFGTSQLRIKYRGRPELRAGVGVRPNLSDTHLKKFYELTGGLNLVSLFYETTRLTWIFDWIVELGSLLRVVGRDPARFDRGWQTIDLPFNETNQAMFEGVVSETDLRDAVKASCTGYSSYYYINRMWQDPEVTFSLNDASCQARVYYRAVLADASRVPIVVPFNIGGINSWTKVTDLVSIMFNIRPK